MEVRWKILLAAVGVGALAAIAVVVLRQPADQPATTALDRNEPKPTVPTADAGAPVAVDQALPGVWVDQSPPGADSKGPLVLALHGRGDTPEHFSAVAGRLGPKWTWRLLKAPLPWRENTQWFRSDAPDQGHADMLAAERLVEAHVRSAPGRKVALLGFSQGCFVAAHFVAEHPSQVAAVVCISGALAYPLDAKPAATATPMLFVHGSEDQVVPLARGRDAADQLKKLGIAVEFTQHTEAHTIPESETAHIREWLERQLR